MADVKVIFRPDGPIQIVGDIQMEKLDGTKINAESDGKGVFLCRCGRSASKPFCDGMHKRAGWKEVEHQETT